MREGGRKGKAITAGCKGLSHTVAHRKWRGGVAWGGDDGTAEGDAETQTFPRSIDGSDGASAKVIITSALPAP